MKQNDITILKEAITNLQTNTTQGTLTALWSIRFQLSNSMYEDAEGIANRLLYKHENENAIEDCVKFLKRLLIDGIDNKQLKEIITDFIIDHKDEIARELYCTDSNVTVDVCVDDNKEIYGFSYCGNTIHTGIVITSGRGRDYPHNCSECDFCDYGIEELEEEGYDVENITIRTLVNEGQIEDSYCNEELAMTVEEYRRECCIEYALSEDISVNAGALALEIIERYNKWDLIELFI